MSASPSEYAMQRSNFKMTEAKKFQELVECSEEDAYMHHTYQMHHEQMEHHNEQNHLSLSQHLWVMPRLTPHMFLQPNKKYCLVKKLEIHMAI